MIRLTAFLAVGLPLTVLFSVLALAGGVVGAGRGWFDWIHRTWSRMLLRLAGTRVEVEGLEALSTGEPQVLVCNHQSLLDIPALFAALPVSLRFVAKVELSRIPVFAGAMRRAGHVFVDREDRDQAIAAMRAAGRRMRAEGLTLGLFPEGTRSRDGRLRPFKKGPFALAVETGTAVVPVALHGGGAILPKGKGRLEPGTLRLRCGRRIEPSDLDRIDRDALRREARDVIASMLRSMGAESRQDACSTARTGTTSAPAASDDRRRRGMAAIQDVRAREILDSRGWPTVEAEVLLEGGARGRASVPSGASTGRHEALELRDGEEGRYAGRGVRRAVANVREELRHAVHGLDARDQAKVDARLLEADGTPNKERLGANALLAVSMAAARAAAEAEGVPLHRRLGGEQGTTLPVPMLNVLNGGAHADNSVDVQEFMIVPVGFGSFERALRAGAETFHALRGILEEAGLSTAVGDEGGVAPHLPSSESALEHVLRAVETAGYAPGQEIALALDCAATELFDPEADAYRFPGEGVTLDRGELIDRYSDWADRYPLVSIEDGLAEDDWEGWRSLTARLGGRLMLVGDDLFVTHPERLRRGIREEAANAVLVKPNQIGTVTETLETMVLARDAGFARVVSHRSGETEDTFIADLAVATGADRIKSGSVTRSERVAKYNRLLRIEERLGARASYAGRAASG